MKFITLTNNFNTEVILCSFGASICSIRTEDKNKKLGHILITPKEIYQFPECDSYFGKTIGRTGGRIADGKFVINGVTYKIESDDPNGLHGGKHGLAWQNFDVMEEENDEAYVVTFTHSAKHLESGYPGKLDLKVTYKLFKNENKLSLNYDATTDQDTLLNLSNHAYFNLNAESGNSIEKQNMWINASKMERVENLLPRAIVDCSEIYSFKTEHEIGKYLHDPEIIENTNGYDYPYILDEYGLDKKSITVKDDLSGRYMNVYTTYPVVVVYTCNYCEDVVVKSNRKLMPYDAVCLECMYHPNTYKSDFLTEKKDLLKKGENYNETIVYEFGTL